MVTPEIDLFPVRSLRDSFFAGEYTRSDSGDGKQTSACYNLKAFMVIQILKKHEPLHRPRKRLDCKAKDGKGREKVNSDWYSARKIHEYKIVQSLDSKVDLGLQYVRPRSR